MLPAEVRAPSGDCGANGHPPSPGRRGLLAGATVALGCERFPCGERGLGKGAGLCSPCAWQQAQDTAPDVPDVPLHACFTGGCKEGLSCFGMQVLC